MTIFDDVTFDSRMYKEIGSLRALGHEVEILCVRYVRSSNNAHYNKALKHPIYVGRRGEGKLRFLRFYLKAPLCAVRAGSDVYHAHDLYTLPIAFLAGKVKARPVVYDSRELFLETASLSRRPLERWVWRLLERGLVRHVYRAITVGDDLADALCGEYRIPRPLVVRNCPLSLSAPKSDALRRRHGLGPDRKILLYLGGLQRGRGLFQIIESLIHLSGHVFVAVGHGPILGELVEHSRRLGVDERVFFDGPVPVERIVEYAASADLGLCIIEDAGFSYAHSLPNKLFEYIAAGLPVVASDLPEIGRVVRTEQVGLLVDPNDPLDIARAVRRILEDAKLYEACRAQCSQASRKYNWTIASQPLAGLYGQLGFLAGAA